MALNIDTLVHWTPGFLNYSQMYEPLGSIAEKFLSFNQWPGLDDYQQVLEALPDPVLTLASKKLKIVKQGGKPGGYEEHYAPRIFMTGEIQTRTENWHDFFQFLTWCIFPKAKAVINSIHVPRAKDRIKSGANLGSRSPIENMLSLFDEGGAIIVSSDESLLQLIRDFQWKEFFWDRRDELSEKLQCIVFGHAMYEKGLKPYIGMTANCILVHVNHDFFNLRMNRRLERLDSQLAEIFNSGKKYTKPKDLSPFPILGMPGWDSGNKSESYYDNVAYFRPGRSDSFCEK